MAQAVEAAFLDHVHISRRIACPQDRGHDQRVNGNVGNGLFRKCVCLISKPGRSSPPWSSIARSAPPPRRSAFPRSEEHTSELQSLMRISYAVFCLKKKKNTQYTQLQRLYH